VVAYNEALHAFFKWDPAKGKSNLVLFAIWDQRSEDQAPATNMATSS
jgi:hypothetical protein